MSVKFYGLWKNCLILPVCQILPQQWHQCLQHLFLRRMLQHSEMQFGKRCICIITIIIIVPFSLFSDCSEIPDDGSVGGIYKISPKDAEPFDALCMFDSNGKWTVLQQRLTGDTYFNRMWVEYQNGFGDLITTGDFWWVKWSSLLLMLSTAAQSVFF